MKTRNPGKPHRQTEANNKRTQDRISQYYGKVALLNTWEKQPAGVQDRNHDYLLELRRQIRNIKNYVMHRASPDYDL